MINADILGARHFYEPQSFSNPQHVAGLMQRQSNLERYLCDKSALYFTCKSSHARGGRYDGSADSEDSVESCESSLASPVERAHVDIDVDAEAEARTAAALHAAMNSSLHSARSSQVSLLLPLTDGVQGKRVDDNTITRSVPELDVFSSSLALSRDREFDMEVDTDTTSLAPSFASLRDSLDIGRTGSFPCTPALAPPPASASARHTTRPTRAQSCGSKRPMTSATAGAGAGEEEKRRRVDEAMVVEEAVSTGVIMPPTPSIGVHAHATVSGDDGSALGLTGSGYAPRMCASTPDLNAARTRGSYEWNNMTMSDSTMSAVSAVSSGSSTPHANICTGVQSANGQSTVPQHSSSAIFGHVVKTSDTHPIIISPFFPVELLPILSRHLVVPRQWTTPLRLASDIDVPSLLLSYVPPMPGSEVSGGEPAVAVVRTPTRLGFERGDGDGNEVERLERVESGVGSGLDVKVDVHMRDEKNGISTGTAGNGNGNGNGNATNARWKPSSLGNLLLSSCPGKRLRMDGPIRGRGPVCRDLKTDLERIKSEGVGCLVW